MKTIEVRCRGCKRVFNNFRLKDIPDNVDYIACNFCPECEDNANDYWKEWYVYKRKNKPTHDGSVQQLLNR